MDPFLLAFLSALFSAVASISAKILLKNIAPQNILSVNFFTMTATLLLFSPLFYFFEATLFAMIILCGLALLDTLANYFYFKTFKNNEASVATPILAVAPIFTIFFGLVLINDTTSWNNFFLSILIIFLIIFFTADFKNFKKFQTKTLFPALSAAILFGLSAIPAKFLLHNLQVINAPTLYMFRSGFIALFSLIIFNFKIQDLSQKEYRFLFLRTLFVIGQWICLYRAMTFINAGVALTISSTAPIFVFFLSAIFLREKISWKKFFAAITILIATFLFDF